MAIFSYIMKLITAHTCIATYVCIKSKTEIFWKIFIGIIFSKLFCLFYLDLLSFTYFSKLLVSSLSYIINIKRFHEKRYGIKRYLD